MAVLPNGDFIAARIDPPRAFSHAECLEEWRPDTASLRRRYCDGQRNVIGQLSVSETAGRVIGLASQIRKTSEGGVDQLASRIDLWDLKSGILLALSSELGRFISGLEISPNGEWILSDGMLLQVCAERP